MNPAARGQPLDASKLSAVAKTVPDYHVGNAAELALPAEYVRVTKALRERPPDEWAQYKTFAKIFKKSEPSTPGAPGSSRRDTEMSGASPGKDQSQSVEEQEDPLAFNLCEKEAAAFANFKKAFGTIIGDLHVPLAGAADPKKCKSEEAFAAFCQDKYGVAAK